VRRRLLAAGAAAAALLLLLALLAARGWKVEAPLPAAPAGSAPEPSPSGRPSGLASLPVQVGSRGLAPSAEGRGAFAGWVRSAADGRAIPGAELTFALGGAAASVRSGSDGAFRFEPPVRGLWTLAAATAEGFLPFAPEWGTSPVLLDARPGAEVAGIEIALEPARDYRGEVVDRAGSPIPGARVRLLGAGTGAAALHPLRDRYETGADGTFTFRAPDWARLEARAAGFAPARGTVDQAVRASRHLRITLSPGEEEEEAGAIAGLVVRSTGEPVAGALVSAHARGSTLPVGQALTDAVGAFAIGDLPAGPYGLEAVAPGLAPGWKRARTGATGVRIELSAGGSLAGRVRERGSGAPVAPFVVTVLRRRGPMRLDPLRSLAVVDAEGRFVVDGLPPGPAAVVVASPIHAPCRPVNVEIAAGERPAWVELELSAGASVEGRVVDRVTRRPLADAEVEAEGVLVESVGAVPLRQRAVTGGDGRFRLTGLPDGRGSLSVSAPGHHARLLSALLFREGEALGPLEIDLAPVEAGEEPRLEMVGIGAILEARGEALRVRRLVPGGGAAQAGIAVDDEILRVDGRPVAELGFGGSVQLLRGPEGTQVVLLVRRGGDGARGEASVTVTRALIRN